jgi:predicted nucleotidyltransferase
VQASRPQSHLRYPLTHVFASAGHVRVLRALAAFGAPLGVAQLASDCGMSARGTRFVLESLVSQGLVGVLGQPRSQVFGLSLDHPMAPAVRALFQQERVRWEQVQDRLREAMTASRHVRAAWLYGSVARGEDQPHSDVDIALLVNDSDIDAADRVREGIRALGDSLSLHVSAVVLAPPELAALPDDDPWWSDVVRDARILKGLDPRAERARCVRLGHAA